VSVQEYLPQLLLWATALSVVTVVATIVLVPVVLERLPEDYFARPRRSQGASRRSPLQLLTITVKNLVGGILVVLGLLMLFTPGQGLVTLLAGLLLMNFPGKYRLERAVMSRPAVFRAVNWLRRRNGLTDFQPPY
jgi:archaellum biogenesis protein FlaJ (TadC family)